jgi:hypothetical protein
MTDALRFAGMTLLAALLALPLLAMQALPGPDGVEHAARALVASSLSAAPADAPVQVASVVRGD